MPENIRKPNFFVIGVVKGGTTSLYHYLDQHPDIYLPPVKETNHFAAADIMHANFLPEYALDVKLDLDAYIASGMKQQVHIAHVDKPGQYAALFAPANGQTALGEISNSYMICPSAAAAIHTYNPDARIIVMLRNPVSRAWSQYLMNLREAKSSSANFISALEADHLAMPKGWGVNHQYLELGKYAGQLKRYIDLFGKDKVLVLFNEDYRQDPLSVMDRICAFLGVSPRNDFDFSTESNKASLPRHAMLNALLVKSGAIRAAKNLTPKSLRKHFAKALYSDKNIPAMTEEEKLWLTDYYCTEVHQLADLIGEEPYLWWPEFKECKPS